MKIKSLSISHPNLGLVTVHAEVPNKIMKSIGVVVEKYATMDRFYSADIYKEDDGSFSLLNMRVVQTSTIEVGMRKEGGSCGYTVTMITNFRVSKDNNSERIYPNGIISLVESEEI
jgi:hypothetical protein